MNCEETHNLIDGYLDGELDLVHSLEMARHIETCSACSQLARRMEGVRTVVRNHAPRYAAPAALVERLRELAHDAPQPAAIVRPFRWQSLAAAAAMIAVIAVGWSLMHVYSGQSAGDRLAMEIYSSHIRSLLLEERHLVDVESSEKHTVKPWFAGKIDFSPNVEDFKDRGFPLAGGRLDVLAGRPVAVLVYRHGGHVINVFIQRLADFAAGADEPRVDVFQGYHLVAWHDSAMRYWGVSDLNRDELEKFAALFQQAAPAETHSDQPPASGKP